MKEKIRIVSIFIALIMLINIFVPTMKVFAQEYGEGNITFTMNISNTNAKFSVHDVKVNGSNWTNQSDVFKTNNGVYVISGTIESTDGTRPQLIYGGNLNQYMGNLSNENKLRIQPEEENEFSFNLTLTNIGVAKDNEGNLINFLSLTLQAEQNNTQVGNGNPDEGNNGVQQGNDDIEIDATFTGTSVEMPGLGEGSILKGTIKGNSTEGTNELVFTNSLGSKPLKEVTINGVTYQIESDNPNIRVVVMPNGIDKEVHITVPAASKYTIAGTADEEAEEAITIIWANPNYVSNNKDWSEEFQLEHGYAYVRAIYRNGQLVDPKTYLAPEMSADAVKNGVREDGFGWVNPKAGDKVIFEFVPDYGYQLTDVKINGQSIGAGNKINEFEFIMPNNNIHFDAVFTKTEDIVKANSDKISAGTISLGNNKLSGGTAQLTVKDSTLSSDKITGFEDAAGEYTISNYLDIDLYQVFYKGKNDSNDVWSKEIKELDGYVIITIKLEEGINADDIVLVHNIHDGDEYEIIEIDSYDPETNTITFKTKSFSSYAIATKTASETATNTDSISPKTGDNIALYIGILIIAGIGLVATIGNIKK